MAPARQNLGPWLLLGIEPLQVHGFRQYDLRTVQTHPSHPDALGIPSCRSISGSLESLKTFFGLLLFALLTGGGAATYWALTPPSLSPQETAVLIRKGRTAASVLQELEERGTIASARGIHLLGRAMRSWPRMKVGEYVIQSRMTPWQVIQVLCSGESILHSVTLREGQNMYELADELEKRGFYSRAEILERLKSPEWSKQLASENAPSVEGFLFPDTYQLTRVMSLDEIIQFLTRRFERAWQPEWNNRLKDLGMTRYQIVTLASIIEKETGSAEERPRISSVFHNRLKKRMPLQSDPTTIYGIWERWDGNLHHSDLVEKTPWNTYAIPALPVGPIGNPGTEALRAALFPADTDSLYFVSRNDGTHEFTPTYELHLAAVRRYQLDARARAGKSWRDLQKKKEN